MLWRGQNPGPRTGDKIIAFEENFLIRSPLLASESEAYFLQHFLLSVDQN